MSNNIWIETHVGLRNMVTLGMRLLVFKLLYCLSNWMELTSGNHIKLIRI